MSKVSHPTTPAKTKPPKPGTDVESGASPASVPASSHGDRKHAKISPSKLKTFEISPRWIPDPDQTVHPITEEGTLCHEVLDGAKPDSALHSDEQRERVKKCRDYTDGFEGERHNEVKLDILDGIWGFADLVIICSTTRAHLIDYKFGANSQEPVETNPAAQAYALGMFKRWPELEQIEVHYLYPRRDEVDWCVFKRSQVKDFELRIKTIIARVKAATSCNPSHETCTWCGRKGTCQDLHKMALPIARRYGEARELKIPEEYDPALVTDPMTMGQMMNAANIMDRWCESVKKHALKLRQETGQEIPGWDLVSRSGKASVLSPVIAMEVAEKYGVTQTEFSAIADIPIGKLRDLIRSKAPNRQKSKQQNAYEDELRDAGALDVGGEVFFLARSKE